MSTHRRKPLSPAGFDRTYQPTNVYRDTHPVIAAIVRKKNELKLSTEEFCEITETQSTTFWNARRGACLPRFSNLVKWADAVGLEITVREKGKHDGQP